jgi:hypothetical protein
LAILKASLQSKTVLTDVFLGNKKDRLSSPGALVSFYTRIGDLGR